MSNMPEVFGQLLENNVMSKKQTFPQAHPNIQTANLSEDGMKCVRKVTIGKHPSVKCVHNCKLNWASQD